VTIAAARLLEACSIGDNFVALRLPASALRG
jgi:hypothetical protein